MIRADFACTNCAEATGVPEITEIIHEDLAVGTKFCPACGSNKGFTQLFTSVNVIGSASRKTQKVIDSSLKPIYERHSTVKAGARSFEQASEEAMEKTYAKATPQERKQLETPVPRVLPAASALGMVSAQARKDTREVITPALLNRKVRPEWQK